MIIAVRKRQRHGPETLRMDARLTIRQEEQYTGGCRQLQMRRPRLFVLHSRRINQWFVRPPKSKARTECEIVPPPHQKDRFESHPD